MNTVETIKDRRSIRARDQRKTRRLEIMRAAQKVIAKQGYQNTSVADVIEAAGISRGTFYLYFDGREALFRDLVDGFIDRLRNCIKQVHRQDGNPVGQLLENLQRVVELLFDNRELTVILLREAVGVDKRIDAKLNELDRFLHRMVSGALKNGAEWGITRKVNESIVAMAVIGSVKEVLYQFLVVDREDAPTRDELAAVLLDFGLSGLALPENGQ